MRPGRTFDLKEVRLWESAARKKYLNPLKVLRAIGIKEKDVVVDIGCGTGFFTVPISKLVGWEGRVYACDVSPEMINLITDKVKKYRIDNIIIHKNDEKIPIQKNEVNVALLADVFHEVHAEERSTTLAEIGRILKVNGKLAILDWKKEETNFGPPMEERIGIDEVVGICSKAGFSLLNTTDFVHHYLLTFGKRQQLAYAVGR